MPDDHVTELVRFCVVPSVYVPVAVNCCVSPLAIERFAGVTAIDWSAAGTTVIVADPDNDPTVALIELVPIPTAFANPVVEMDAVVRVPDTHVAELVRFCVVPSL